MYIGKSRTKNFYSRLHCMIYRLLFVVNSAIPLITEVNDFDLNTASARRNGPINTHYRDIDITTDYY